jgi:hypothetical protein
MSCFSFLLRRNAELPTPVRREDQEESLTSTRGMGNESTKLEPTAAHAAPALAEHHRGNFERRRACPPSIEHDEADRHSIRQVEGTGTMQSRWLQRNSSENVNDEYDCRTADQGPSEEAAPMRRKEMDVYKIRLAKPAPEAPWPIRADHKGEDDGFRDGSHAAAQTETAWDRDAQEADVGPGETWDGAGINLESKQTGRALRFGKHGELLMDDLMPDEDLGEQDRMNHLNRSLKRR